MVCFSIELFFFLNIIIIMNSPVVVILSLLQLINMMFLEQQPLVFNNQQWAANSTCICINPDLSFSEVPHHRNLKTHSFRSTIVLYSIDLHLLLHVAVACVLKFSLQ